MPREGWGYRWDEERRMWVSQRVPTNIQAADVLLAGALILIVLVAVTAIALMLSA